ncbi:MAG: FHA domain-containing protein, partial [Chloroflexi bacterium]
MAILRVFYPDSNTRDYQLPPTHGQIFLIGRADNANLQFEHNPDFDFVSDYHAYIINQHGQYFICDGSPDGTPSIVGTFVNGKPISNQPYPLTPNDKITIGSSNFGIPIQFITNQTQPQYSQQLPYYGQHPSASYPMHHYNSVTVNGIQYQLAGFGTRLVAYIIDGIILSIISSVVVTIIWSLFGPNINNELYNL